jgi:hypothetical protein
VRLALLVYLSSSAGWLSRATYCFRPQGLAHDESLSESAPFRSPNQAMHHFIAEEVVTARRRLCCTYQKMLVFQVRPVTGIDTNSVIPISCQLVCFLKVVTC